MPRLGQSDQLQVAVDLPEILDVADPPRIAIIESEAEIERRLDPGLGIDVPAGREAEARILERKHIEAALEDAVRGPRVARRVEFPRQGRDPGSAADSRRMGGTRQADAGALGAPLNLAPQPEADFTRTHGPQPAQGPVQPALGAP